LRFVQPCSKSFTTELYSDTCLPEITKVPHSSYNKARVFRELEVIERFKDKLGSHIFSYAKTNGLTKGEMIFYDLSSGNISGLKCILAKWGHCKDGYRTHVVLMLVITPEGYPIYWEILEGNTADVKTIKNLVCKIEKVYGKVESVVCFDRGMVSNENLELLEGKTIRFITALDGNQIQHFDEIINFELIEKAKAFDLKNETNRIEKCLTKENFIFVKKNLFYQEIKLSKSQKEHIEKSTSKLNLEKRRYFLSFNPEMAYLKQKHRKQRVNEFLKWIEEYNKDLNQALGSRKKGSIEKLIKKELKRQRIFDVDIKYNLSKYTVENKNKEGRVKKATTYKITIEKITDESYSVARKYDGLWILLTNINDKDEIEFFRKSGFNDFFEIYRLKNRIEESFKIISDFVEIEPFYVYKPEHIKAHFTICVLSYLLDITILNKVRNNKGFNNMSLHSLFRELRKCKQDIIQLDETKTISKITQLTETQKHILNVLECSYLISPKHLIANQIIST
jgi:transposase